MKGCSVTFCINTGRLCIIHLICYFNGFVFFVCISVHPLSSGRDISSFFCKFAPICKAPLYARTFGNLLYQHKKAFTLLIENIFSMVLYSLYVFQCTRFQMDGIFPRTSVNSPLYVRRLYMQGCLVTFCITQEGLCIIHLRYYFNGFILFVCISVHPLSTGGIFPRSSVNSPLYVRRPYMQGCLVTFCINTRRPLHY